MEWLLHVVSPVALEAANHLRQGDDGRVMIKTKPFDGVQSIDSVGKRDELDSDQGAISAAIINIALSFLAATDDRGEQGTGAELHNVAIVE